MDKSNYKVSVRLITYNHQEFISETVQSVLDQKTNFLVELVIGDDFSKDNTRELLKDFKSTENVRIHLLDRPVGGEYWKKRNALGRLYNFMNTVESCTGEFIALLDGDDYWTDPLKLQKQVDFLEKNRNFSACFTNALIIDENNRDFKEKFIDHSSDKAFSLEKAAKRGGGFFPTSSLLFRNKLKELPSFFLDVKSGDRALILLLANLGEIYFLNEVTCVYRKHSGGIYTSIENNNSKRLEIDLNNIKLLDNFNEFTNCKHQGLIETIKSNYSQRILIKYPKELIKNLKPKLIANLLFLDKIRLLKNSVFVASKK